MPEFNYVLRNVNDNYIPKSNVGLQPDPCVVLGSVFARLLHPLVPTLAPFEPVAPLRQTYYAHANSF